MKYQYQSERTKAGEITMRRKEAIEEWLNPSLIWPRIKGKAEETIKIFEGLRRDYGLYLYQKSVGEIGAGRCQRILALIDKYACKGFAFDISLDVLCLSRKVSLHCYRNNPHTKLGLAPGDFLDESEKFRFDVLFCIATVHHFPDPRPVFRKAYKMLKRGGYFYFDHEPLQSKLGFHELIRILRGGFAGLKKDRDQGILETQFPLSVWREAFDIFEDSDIKISFPPFKRKFKVRPWHEWTGGRLSGILRKGARL